MYVYFSENHLLTAIVCRFVFFTRIKWGNRFPFRPLQMLIDFRKKHGWSSISLSSCTPVIRSPVNIYISVHRYRICLTKLVVARENEQISKRAKRAIWAPEFASARWRIIHRKNNLLLATGNFDYSVKFPSCAGEFIFWPIGQARNLPSLNRLYSPIEHSVIIFGLRFA